MFGFFVVLIAGSCGRESTALQEDPVNATYDLYENSQKAWMDLKSKNGDSYIYTVMETSWTGAGNTTTLEIRDDKVVRKYYEEYVISEETGEKTIQLTFEESGSGIGTDPRGARALTIDELYELCLSDYLVVDEEANEIYFETRSEGIISLCGYVPEDCIDDCFQGFTITEFEWL